MVKATPKPFLMINPEADTDDSDGSGLKAAEDLMFEMDG